jgi:hypothetical protein
MAYNRVQARRLLSASEMDMFESSLAERASSLAPERVRVMIRRSRTLRDKYADLLRRQRLATRTRTGTKSGAGGGANERTAQKAQLFAEVLQRFEARLSRLEAAEADTARKASSKRAAATLEKKRAADAAKAASRHPRLSPKAPAGKAPEAPGPIGATSERARAAAHAMRFKASGSRAVQGHISSLGRRNQAKRDRRR